MSLVYHLTVSVSGSLLVYVYVFDLGGGAKACSEPSETFAKRLFYKNS